MGDGMPNFFCIAEGRIDMGDAFLTDIDPTSTTSVVSRRPTVGRDRSANLLQHSFWHMSARVCNSENYSVLLLKTRHVTTRRKHGKVSLRAPVRGGGGGGGGGGDDDDDTDDGAKPRKSLEQNCTGACTPSSLPSVAPRRGAFPLA